MKKAAIDRRWLSRTRYVYIAWWNNETHIVDDETGVIVWSSPTYPRALENAVAFVRRHSFTLRRLEVLS